MDLSKKLLTLLAIFCVIASAGVVCAEDVGSYADGDYVDDVDGWAGSQYEDDGGWAGSQYEDYGGWAGSQYEDDGGWAGSQYNETAENATGEPVNETVQTVDDAPVNENATAPHVLHATGNPILALMAVGAVLGGACVLRRK